MVLELAEAPKNRRGLENTNQHQRCQILAFFLQRSVPFILASETHPNPQLHLYLYFVGYERGSERLLPNLGKSQTEIKYQKWPLEVYEQ